MTKRELPIIEVTTPAGGPTLVVVAERTEIGRECRGLLVADDLVSRRHLAVWEVDGDVWVEDLGSANGTRVEGAPLVRPQVLAPGVVVDFGASKLVLSELRAAKPAPPAVAAGARNRATMVPGGPRPVPGQPSTATMVVRPAPSGGSDERATTIGTLASVVAAEAPAGPPPSMVGRRPTHGGTVTFMFSDIEASTSLAESMGDKRWFEVLGAHNRLLEGVVHERGGTVVKTIGDGYLCTFGTARQAIRAAVDIQDRLVAPEADPLLDAIRVRIGLHTGEAIEDGGDVYGLHVNIASRVADLAGGGEVVVSELTRAIVRTAGDLRFDEERQVELKGLAMTYGVSRLLPNTS